MSLETEITALRAAVERLAELPAALDRLTQAVHGHAATRLAIFERAGREALAAIPPVPGEDAAAVIAEYAVPFANPAAIAPPPWVLRPEAATPSPEAAPARTPVSLAEVQEVATEMIRSGNRELVQDALVNKIGVGNIGQLTPEQRIAFMDLALDAGWLPRTMPPMDVRTPAAKPAAEVRMPPAANQPHDEPPPAEVTPEDALAMARRLIETGRGPLFKDLLANQIRVKSLEHLNPVQRVEFVRLAANALAEVA